MFHVSGVELLLGITLLVIPLYALRALLKKQTDFDRLPTPPDGEILWGHEKQIFMSEPGHAFRRWTRVLGPTYRIKAALGARDILVLGDPGGIAYLLQKQVYHYHHSSIVRPRIARLLGKGLGWVEGELEHKRMRQLVYPALSQENIKAMSTDVRFSALQVLDALTLRIQSDDKAVVNVVEWMAKTTLNIIGRVVFLHDFEGGDSNDAVQILEARRLGISSVAKYAGFITLMILRRFPRINDVPLSIFRAQGLAKMAVHSGVTRELLRRSNELCEGDGFNGHKDLLSRLLAAHSRGEISTDELKDQISTFMISGHETTTQALSFTLWELSRRLSTQRRLREEINAFSGEPTYEDFQARLPYLDAVLKETLRMYPGLPYMERVATKADLIPLRHPIALSCGRTVSSVPISPGQVVVIPILAIQRSESIWRDSDQFIPERWLETLPGKDELLSGYSNTLSFSDGPRSCIGMRLAIFQYKVVLSEVMRRFVLHPVEEPIRLQISSSLQACSRDKPELGPFLPVRFELL